MWLGPRAEVPIPGVDAQGPKTEAMISHVSLGVSDLLQARRFYAAILAPLGYVEVWSIERGSGYGLPGGNDKLALFEKKGEDRLAAGPGFHLAFAAPDQSAVRSFYNKALEHGGVDAGKPGLRPHYSPTYFAAFVIDPDGHKLEAVHQ